MQTFQNSNTNAHAVPIDANNQPLPAHKYEDEADIYYAESSNALPSYVDPGQLPYTVPQGYSGIAPYADANIAYADSGYNPGAFAVQSGYEGYLVPGPPPVAVEASSKEITPKQAQPSFFESISNPFTSLVASLPLPRSVMGFIQSLFGMMSMMGMGAAMTTAICTFTPLCSISFAGLPLFAFRSGFKDLDDTSPIKTLAKSVNAEEFINQALAKYSEIHSNQKEAASGQEATSTVADLSATREAAIAESVEDVKKIIAKADSENNNDIPAAK